MKHDILKVMSRSTQCCGFIKMIVVACLVTGLLSCSKQDRPSPPPTMKWIRHSKPTPLQPSMLMQATVDKIKKCNSLAELCPFDRFIPLQGVIIGDFTQLIRINNFFFVLDRLQRKIFKFDLQGKFIQEISQKGQGPGEFEVPSMIKQAFDQNIAIVDGIRSRIIILNLDGKYVTSYATQTKQGTIFLGSNFIWPTSGRLILGGFLSDKETGPWHVILERTGEEYEVITGFGERFEPFIPLKLGILHMPIFSVVGETIWVGSRHATTINVYSKTGEFLYRTGNKIRPNGVTRAHFDTIPKDPAKAREYRNELMKLQAPRSLCVVGDLVLVGYGETFCVFDHNGNIIKDFILRNGRAPIFDSFDKEVYSAQIVDEGKGLSQEERDYLVNHLGVDFGKTSDLNPFIRVGLLPYE